MGAPRTAISSPPEERGQQQLPRRGAFLIGGAAAFLVGRDGSLPWQATRVALVALLTGGLVTAIARGARGQRAAAALAAGAAAVAGGVGIGVPHLAKTGIRPTTGAGLVLLAGGLVLYGFGSFALVRHTGRWQRALAVPALATALILSLVTLGQAVAVTNVPRTSVGSTTPSTLGFAYEDVEVTTDDGVTLSGWYIPSRNGAAVVLLHGAGSTRADVLDQAVVLARHRFGVLLFDARGHGRSGGRAMDFGWYGNEDTSAAVSYLERRPDVSAGRIAALGMSMGGEEAIGAAATDQRISAVVAEGATNRVAADKAWLSEAFGWRGAIQERVDWLTYTFTDALTAADPPITLRRAVALAAPRPVLLIAGGDVTDEAHAAHHIQGGSPTTVELWVVPGAGHTAGLDTHPDEWEQRVIGFFDATIGGPPRG